MLGERTGQRYRLSDRIRVQVARVDLESSRLDFVLPGAVDGDAREGRSPSRPVAARGRERR